MSVERVGGGLRVCVDRDMECERVRAELRAVVERLAGELGAEYSRAARQRFRRLRNLLELDLFHAMCAMEASAGCLTVDRWVRRARMLLRFEQGPAWGCTGVLLRGGAWRWDCRAVEADD
ncbi:hypothetical protein Pyrde_0699 [Pyrodictium delaneyi]|uniref:Uncharacterized protein n=1 Tax=Pyrodictium delaneyi TaxID=1273541 RepID=A0A0P0N366_9CREN|nr:hypothetical protein Pyrde_0699 [Pyrodictium delaneyi]